MSDGIDKLKKDLVILEAMAADMDDYLQSISLFWPLGKPSLPKLTLGGYLMRQHRLTILRDLLDEGEQARLDRAIDQFNAALDEKVVRFEQRAHEELHARLRQWSEYLKEMPRESLRIGDYYASAVDARLMIAALLEKLSLPPYQLDENVVEETGVYDRVLRNYWAPGDFVLPAEWKPAYPQADYWWLYGHPRTGDQA